MAFEDDAILISLTRYPPTRSLSFTHIFGLYRLYTNFLDKRQGWIHRIETRKTFISVCVLKNLVIV